MRQVSKRPQPWPSELRPEPQQPATRIASHRRKWSLSPGSGTRQPVPRLRDRMPETPGTYKHKTRLPVHSVCNLHICCANLSRNSPHTGLFSLVTTRQLTTLLLPPIGSWIYAREYGSLRNG